MSDPRPPAVRRRDPKPPFFWIAIAIGLLALGLFVIEGVHAIQFAGYSRHQGWTETRAGDEWRIATVDPAGPAAGRLEPGDRLVAIDGDRRAARFGAHWRLERLDPGRPYSIEVLRGTSAVLTSLTLGTRYDPSYISWVLVYLLIAASFYGVGMMMAVAKPESRTVQFGFASSLLMAAFLVWVATRPVDGIHRDAIAAALSLSFPFDLVAGLFFFDCFPHPVEASQRWRRAIRLVAAFGCVLWVPRSYLVVLHAMPVDLALRAVERTSAVVGAYETVAPLLELMTAIGLIALNFALLVRNYRMLDGQGERRQIRLVLWGHALAFVPAIVLALVAAALQGLGFAAHGSPSMLRLTLAANVLFIASPVSFGYAIVKHRVLGFRVFIRLGIQHMLARNVLRAAVALPALVIIYSVVANPNRTVSEIIFSGSGRVQAIVLALAGAGLRFRGPLAASIDRRFFRTAYDQEIILLRLVDSIKQLDSLTEISAMVSREIDAALHVTRLLVVYRSPADRSLSIGYTSVGGAEAVGLAAASPLIEDMARAPVVRSRDDVVSHCGPEEAEWLERLQIELLVPITGIDRALFGLLLVGEKRSEEPYTSKDRNLLQMVAAQMGAVCEVLALREQVGQQHRIQTEVLGRLDRQQINLVRECPSCGRCFDSSAERCPDDDQTLVLSLPVDRTLDGKYRLERLIGRGGMGAVYEATDLRLNRRVAAKVVRSAMFGSSAMQRRFAREAQACGRLAHSNIVRIYDFGMAGETAYLVMEYVHGVTLRAQLNRVGSYSTAVAATLLDQVLDGMESAHAAGVLHRDLKPENLLICTPTAGAAPEVKILDFGLAKVREAGFVDPKSMTMQGVAIGTFGYMSPEQLLGEEVDERTDVYAIGVIALETLTGRLTIEGMFFHRMIETELNRRLIVPAATAAHVRLARAIERALAPNAAKRFASIAEMRAELVPAIAECPAVPLGNAAIRTSVGPIATGAVTGAQADAETAGGSALPPTPPGKRA
jgi:eukaryotic-like serine/threonine-protein kinase